MTFQSKHHMKEKTQHSEDNLAPAFISSLGYCLKLEFEFMQSLCSLYIITVATIVAIIHGIGRINLRKFTH